MALVHASCVAIEGAGVLLIGPSGSGKSDLALRLIDGGAALVADDQVALSAAAGVLVAAAPAAIAGRIEVRGLGILALEPRRSVPVALAVALLSDGRPPRHPEPALWRHDGIEVPRIALSPFEASAAAKVRLAVRALAHDSGRAGAPVAAAGRGPGSLSGAGR